jgi:hypothetical protein
MQTRGPASYDVIVTIDGFATKFPDLRRVLRPLTKLSDGSNLLSVDIYHRNRADSALLLLHIDMRCVTGTLIRNIATVCGAAGFQIVLVNEIHRQNRQIFYKHHLAQFEVGLPGLPTPIDAIQVLADHLGVSQPKKTSAQVVARDPVVHVRFLRGQQWHLGRICRLSDSGIYIATTAIPRQGDIIETELTLATRVLKVPAQVVQVSSLRAAEALGTLGFGARLLPSKRQDLIELGRFAAAFSNHADLLQPTPRRSPRYVVRWPGWIEAKGRRVRVTVLDASKRGMFFAGPVDLQPNSEVRVLIPIEDHTETFEATGRVVRTVTPTQATKFGSEVGLAVELTKASPEQISRYTTFIDRVSKRVERHVVVGSDAQRMPELVENLRSAGYYVIGASEPREVFALAVANTPPDLVLVDQSLKRTHRRGADALKTRLHEARVPMLEVKGDANPRLLVDKVLGTT